MLKHKSINLKEKPNELLSSHHLMFLCLSVGHLLNEKWYLVHFDGGVWKEKQTKKIVCAYKLCAPSSF